MMLAFSVPMGQSTLLQPSQSQDSSSSIHNMSAPLLSTVPTPASLRKARPGLPSLTLNTDTSQKRTFGKGSSLRLETLSAISPTVRNTFSNGYEPAKGLQENSARLDTPSTPGDSRTPSSCSSTETSSILEAHVIPYTQPHSLKSVLSNSPIPRTEVRRMSVNPVRPMFPAEKRVSFRDPLIEEIQTTKYTLAHSDIKVEDMHDISDPEIASTASDASTTSLTTDSTSDASISPPNAEAPLAQVSPARANSKRTPHRLARMRLQPTGPQTGDKRDSSSDDSDSDNCPETPVAGRRKRVREWTWTLGSLPGSDASASSFTPARETSTSPIVAPANDAQDAEELSECYILSPQVCAPATLPQCTSPWSSNYPSSEAEPQ